MPRVTRAKAAELAETLHIDEDVVLELNDDPATAEHLDFENLKIATPEASARSRSPLCEIAPNSAESKGADEEGKGWKRRKAARKGKGGKKDDLGASVASQAEGVKESGEMKEGAEVEEVDMSQSAPATASEDQEAPLAKEQVEEGSKTGEILPTIAIDATNAPQDKEMDMESPPASPIATATPRVIQSLRKETTGKRSTSNKENVEPFSATPITTPTTVRAEQTPTTSYDELEAAAMSTPAPAPSSTVRDLVAAFEEPAETVAAKAAMPEVVEETSPEKPAEVEAAMPDVVEEKSAEEPAVSSPKAENPIEALDELDEAVEKVSQEIPEVVATPGKKREKKVVSSPVQMKTAVKSSKPAPVVRLTKATQARLSLAQGTKLDTPNTPSLGRPRPSVALGRSSSVRQSTAAPVSVQTALGRSASVRQSTAAPAQAQASLGRANSVRQSTAPAPVPSKHMTSTTSTSRSSKPTEPREKKEAVIPHSKPRPISLSFPTPPPPQRSTKPTTKSSFQLPGEAVAAKLKAAREERMLSASTTTKPSTEEGKVVERKVSFKARPAPSTTGLKKTPSVRHTAASRARESIMNGSAPAPAPANSLRRSTTVPTSRAPRPSTVPSSTSTLTSSKRSAPAETRSNTSVPAETRSNTSVPTTSGNRVTSTSSVKGKEVFNRAAVAKADAEKEKREKEEGAKRARAEAAERGRLASREWAEKQKARKAGAARKEVAVEAA